MRTAPLRRSTRHFPSVSRNPFACYMLLSRTLKLQAIMCTGIACLYDTAMNLLALAFEAEHPRHLILGHHTLKVMLVINCSIFLGMSVAREGRRNCVENRIRK